MYFDRFDIAEAHYVYWSENHTGQFSRGYERLCKADKIFTRIRPSLSDRESLTENGQAIYDALAEKESHVGNTTVACNV